MWHEYWPLIGLYYSLYKNTGLWSVIYINLFCFREFFMMEANGRSRPQPRLTFRRQSDQSEASIQVTWPVLTNQRAGHCQHEQWWHQCPEQTPGGALVRTLGTPLQRIHIVMWNEWQKDWMTNDDGMFYFLQSNISGWKCQIQYKASWKITLKTFPQCIGRENLSKYI